MARKVDKEGTKRRKRQIVQAAAECFKKNGVHRSTMHDICARVGLSPGTVYHYFKSKDEIIAHIAEGEVLRSIEFAEHLKASPSLEQGLYEVVDDILGSREYDDGFQIYMEIVCEAGRNREVGRLLLKADDIALKAIRQKLKAEKFRFPGASPDVLAAFIGGQLESLEMFKRYGPSKRECREMALVCKRSLSDMLRPPADS